MKSQPIHPDFERILLSEKEIEDICEDLGAKLNKDYAGKVPTILAVLKGVTPFLTDLSKQFKFYCDYEYVASSSYHGGVVTSNWVEIYLWPRLTLRNKDVLIIEDRKKNKVCTRLHRQDHSKIIRRWIWNGL